MHKQFTSHEKHQLHKLHAQGLSRNEIARQMKRSPATIGKYAEAMGLGFDRTLTENATRAKSADAAALRAQLKLDLLHDAQKLRKQLFSPTVVYAFGGKDNQYREHTLSCAPADVQRNIMTSIGIAVQRSIDLERVDQKQDANTPAFDAYLATLGVGQIGGTH